MRIPTSRRTSGTLNLCEVSCEIWFPPDDMSSSSADDEYFNYHFRKCSLITYAIFFCHIISYHHVINHICLHLSGLMAVNNQLKYKQMLVSSILEVITCVQTSLLASHNITLPCSIFVYFFNLMSARSFDATTPCWAVDALNIGKEQRGLLESISRLLKKSFFSRCSFNWV